MTPPLGLSVMEWQALTLSLRSATLAVLWSLPLAIGLGWLLARRRFPGHWLLNAVVHLPLVLPPVVIGYLLLVLLGREGVIGAPLHALFGVRLAFSTQAVVIACAVVSFPLLVRAIRQSAESMDHRFEAAARSLGAGELRVFLTVTLPLMSPGILTGLTLGFARAVGEFGATITLAANIPGKTQTLPLALFSVTQSPGGDAAAARLCALSLALAGMALIGSELVSRRMTWEAAR
ncbi:MULTISPECIES: molybdate ABC transporter permease subunit [Actibacterium]|uniref:Molybdenum transport system permease n=1 Tax=Actibacterium naphthalenivorans TaxID=1614693 RepID=A0A840CAT8_9RHOB|nr:MULTISPECIES: molybdate ABC transporter permease subunit [Actibacterium]MBB4020678.1 molybdate transport system permease protein [Actibacterium naphthalenivorans]